MKENNNAYAYISIVAIVAIVATLVMFAGSNRGVTQTPSIGGDVVGDARHLPTISTQTIYDPSNPIPDSRMVDVKDLILSQVKPIIEDKHKIERNNIFPKTQYESKIYLKNCLELSKKNREITLDECNTAYETLSNIINQCKRYDKNSLSYDNCFYNELNNTRGLFTLVKNFVQVIKGTLTSGCCDGQCEGQCDWVAGTWYCSVPCPLGPV